MGWHTKCFLINNGFIKIAPENPVLWAGFFITVMDREKIKSILSLLEQYELTLREKQFVEAVEKYFNRNGKITDQQECLLEGIYREKIWIKRAFFSHNNLLLKGSSSKAA
jgi:hypothetical protein